MNFLSFNFYLDKYLTLSSLWSGVHDVHPTKNRDTNTNVENWFRIVKHHSFENTRFRLKCFVEKLFNSLDARYIERSCVLSMQKVKNFKVKQLQRKLDNNSLSIVEEMWSKKELCPCPAKKEQFKIFYCTQ